MLRATCSLVIVALALALTAGCEKNAEPASATGDNQAVNTAPKPSAVARLAFLDKADACDCTKANIDKGWTALQAALGAGNAVPVDRIHMDTQADQAAPLLAQRKIVAVPALYLLDASGNVLDLMQGDIQEAAVRKALQ
jgi:hypothetical protein